MANDLTTAKGLLQTGDSEYVRLVSQISDLWENAKNKAALAINTELLDANWQTGQYIVEFEQGGNAKAKYGDRLLVNLSKDLTRLRGRGFSRSVLTYMRKFYLAFPKCATVSHKLSWSHDLELLKCDDPLEMQFYMKECLSLYNVDSFLPISGQYPFFLVNPLELSFFIATFAIRINNSYNDY